MMIIPLTYVQAAAEHWLASFIPTPVSETWNKTISFFRSKEIQQTGHDRVSETVEMATWGVEEAEARNKSDASRFCHTPCTDSNNILTLYRSGNTAGSSICHSQELHLRQSPSDSSHNTQSRQDLAVLGLADWAQKVMYKYRIIDCRIQYFLAL